MSHPQAVHHETPAHRDYQMRMAISNQIQEIGNALQDKMDQFERMSKDDLEDTHLLNEQYEQFGRDINRLVELLSQIHGIRANNEFISDLANRVNQTPWSSGLNSIYLWYATEEATRRLASGYAYQRKLLYKKNSLTIRAKRDGESYDLQEYNYNRRQIAVINEMLDTLSLTILIATENFLESVKATKGLPQIMKQRLLSMAAQVGRQVVIEFALLGDHGEPIDLE